jgi:hypothetical protein
LKNVDIRKLRLVSAGIGATALVAMGVLGVVFGTAGLAEADGSTGSVKTGQTVTSATPPRQPLVSAARPSITGAAPLPSEEQGLPG